VRHVISLVTFCLCASLAFNSFADECPPTWKTLHPEWIWCDDFETDKTASYFEKTGPFNRTAGVGFQQLVWNAIDVDFWIGGWRIAEAGVRADTARQWVYPPVGVDATSKFREIYYRVYLKSQAGWVNPNTPNNSKFVRAMVTSASDWSQAMIAHVWSDQNDNNF